MLTIFIASLNNFQVKLDSQQEQLSSTKRAAESSEEATQQLKNRISELTTRLDQARANNAQLNHEKEMLCKSLDSARTEKTALDKNRMELNAMVAFFRFVTYSQFLRNL